MTHRYEVKRIDRDAGDDSLEDARALAAIDDPHLSTAMEIAPSESRPSLFVIEMPHGESLATRGLGAMSAEDAVHVALQIAHGLVAAHAAGVIHRNIRPKNVMLQRTAFDDAFVKLVGFGRGPRKTRDRFVPPEGATKKVAGPHTDVFGVGACLEAMLGPDARREASLAVIIAKATADDPKKRYASAAALEDALRAWAPAKPEPVAVPTTLPPRRPDTAWVLLGAFVAIGVALIAFNDHHDPVPIAMARPIPVTKASPPPSDPSLPEMGPPPPDIGPPTPDPNAEPPPAPSPAPIQGAPGTIGARAPAAIAPTWQPPSGGFYVDEPLRYVGASDGEAWRVATSKKVMRCIESIGSGDCALNAMELHCTIDKHGVVNCSRMTPHDKSGRVCEVPTALDDCIGRAAGGLVAKPRFDRGDVQLAEMKYWLRRVR